MAKDLAMKYEEIEKAFNLGISIFSELKKTTAV